MKENFIIKILKYGASTDGQSKPFSELSNELTKIVGDVNVTQHYINEFWTGSHESIRFKGSAYLDLLDWEELQQARKDSQQARKEAVQAQRTAIWSLRIAIFTAIVSAIYSHLGAFKGWTLYFP